MHNKLVIQTKQYCTLHALNIPFNQVTTIALNMLNFFDTSPSLKWPILCRVGH